MSNPNQPPTSGTTPPAPGATAPAKPKKPWYKKWWVWLLALIVLVGIGNALNGGSSTDQATQRTAGDATASAPAQTGQTASQPEQAAASEPAKTEAPKKDRLTLEDGWKLDRSNPYAVFVTGYVTNNTDKAIDTYVQITFDALDAEGANLGTCLANTNTVDANGKWKFKAMCSGEAKEIKEVRFKEISGF